MTCGSDLDGCQCSSSYVDLPQSVSQSVAVPARSRAPHGLPAAPRPRACCAMDMSAPPRPPMAEKLASAVRRRERGARLRVHGPGVPAEAHGAVYDRDRPRRRSSAPAHAHRREGAGEAQLHDARPATPRSLRLVHRVPRRARHAARRSPGRSSASVHAGTASISPAVAPAEGGGEAARPPRL